MAQSQRDSASESTRGGILKNIGNVLDQHLVFALSKNQVISGDIFHFTVLSNLAHLVLVRDVHILRKASEDFVRFIIEQAYEDGPLFSLNLCLLDITR